ncbi:MAG: DUF2793 domain-containing protein [Mesorhizobium sp.]|nr:DUF2793 domain-containing protein [Mesorhizobium sp.]MBL8577457.1 DUF2793 domain-containing protein [Mesorhizobium sp.]
MENSANLLLPYIMPSQAQKHVTHNEAIRKLDALVQLSVLDRDLASPPPSPVDGDRYLVAAGGTGTWAGKDGKIAAWQDGAWAFLAPKTGWMLWLEDEGNLLAFDGDEWRDAVAEGLNPASFIGVNATADLTSRFTVKSPATLFDEEAGDHRLKVNKATPADTASMLFQTGYSGRAELGLAGDNDLHIKVSADGDTWSEALKVDTDTGAVSLPTGLPLGNDDQVATRRHIRERLTANRTYYVRTDGSDSNGGLSDSSGGAFLTIGRANQAIGEIDLNGHAVTIDIGAGTFAEQVEVPVVVGLTTYHYLIYSGAGDTTIITSNLGYQGTIQARLGAGAVLQNCKIANPNANGYGCLSLQRGWLRIGDGIKFGSCGGSCITVQGSGSYVLSDASFTLDADVGCLVRAIDQGGIQIFGNTIAMGTRTVMTTIEARNLGFVEVNSVTFTGTVTGKRYDVGNNALINTNGAGASYIPGNVAGDAWAGGAYA